MDSVDWIAAACGAFGFAVGYLLAYVLARRDVNQAVAMRVDALHLVGAAIAKTNGGQVPWTAVARNLDALPHTYPNHGVAVHERAEEASGDHSGMS